MKYTTLMFSTLCGKLIRNKKHEPSRAVSPLSQTSECNINVLRIKQVKKKKLIKNKCVQQFMFVEHVHQM